MANPLRKTMVYLGLADEEYDEPQEQAQERQQPARQQPAPQQQRAQAPAAAPTPDRAPVTPLRRSAPAPTRQAAPADMNEILTVHPRHYKDAQSIAESFREGIPVIINLSQMTEAEARRLIDFASGLSQGLHGRIERVTSKVFLLSPSHVAISGDHAEPESDVEAAFFAG
jgi:cell division inhibitor SepF